MSDGDVLKGFERALVFNRLRAEIGLRFEMPILLDDLSLPANARALELGAGTGWASLAVARRFRPAITVVTDYDPDVLPAARRTLAEAPSRIAVARVDAKRLPFADGAFDLVLMIFALHHVMGYEQAVAEAARVLRTAGCLLVAEILRAFPVPRLRRHAPPEGLLSPRELQTLLARAGFTVERERGLPFVRYLRARRAS